MTDTVDLVLQITEPSVTLDSYATTALEKTRLYYQDKDDNLASSDQAKTYLATEGMLGTISVITERLNKSGLDNVLRLLLSEPIIYATLLRKSIYVGDITYYDSTVSSGDGIDKDDTEGIYNSVLRHVSDIPKRYFLARMIALVLDDKHIQVQAGDKRWEQLEDLLLEQELPITVGKVEPAVNELLSTIYTEGDIPHYVEQFVENLETKEANGESTILPSSVFTTAIKQGMTDYLVKLGVQITSESDFTNGVYNEYFFLAYNEALKIANVAEDPIDTARIKGGETTWDFSVDTFESIEEQGVSPDNILAAGALDYIYCIGERMHVFDVANALVLRWAGGVLDVPDGTTAAALYRYHKLRSERSTPQERAMLYRRVLNRGGGQLLSNMVANEDFPRLWHQLMSEVAEYIRKAEGSYSAESWVSKAPIYQATKNLQYNLSETMTGMAHLQVTEDYAHLQEALDIIKADYVLTSYGGRRESIWTVVEQVAKEDLGIMVSSAPIRTSAVEGNKVFQWISNFNEGSVQDSSFQSFLSSAEAWIIAQASMEEDDGSFGRDGDGMDDMDGMDDDFDDWD
ncbi:hypothetical protein SPB21_34650 [Leptothoe sp. ISB3NOV94-8A]